MADATLNPTPPTPKMSYLDLMSADPETLSMEDLTRRINLTSLHKAEREVELVESQNQVFQDQKTDKKRVADVKTAIIIEGRERIHGEQTRCQHKTGGKGLTGFHNGDGKQGYSVATQILPTGERYFICFRCQKEWHLPSKRAVLKGEMTLAKYFEQEKLFNLVASWEKPLFETDDGEFPGSVLFRIPRLENQRSLDDMEFHDYLEKHQPAMVR